MERAVALARGSRVEVEDLPEEIRREPQAGPGPGPERSARTLEEVEKEHILATLLRNGGNQTRAAKELRIGSATLYRKLKRYGLVGGRAPAEVESTG
jgi:transcriptional regulator of acetoin/glycerol metabolism